MFETHSRSSRILQTNPSKLKSFLLYIALGAFVTQVSGCKIFNNYREITKTPERIHQELELPRAESSIDVAVRADFATLEQEINAALGNEYKGKNESTLEYKKWIKVENPLYHPNEWIVTKDLLYNPKEWLETKDPLYNPKKWIKVGPLKTKNPLYHPNKWIKTKNPLYHPNEWIKTKDPLYNPTEWIETKGPSIAVGYQYEYTITKKSPIRLSSVNHNALRIAIPIKFNGSVGLVGDAAKLLTLNKKNFEGAIEFFVDVDIEVDSTWCPNVHTLVTHNWLTNPTIEIMDGINISVTGLTDSYIEPVEKDVNQLIKRMINCDEFREQIAGKWKHYAIQLPTLPDGQQYYANVNPTGASLSKFIVKPDSMELFVGMRANVTVDSKPVNTTTGLPSLGRQSATESQVNMYLPLLVQYADLQSNINKYLKEKGVTIRKEKYNQTATLQIKEATIYPHGDELAVGAFIKTKLPGRLFSTVGWVYLTAKPIIREGKFFELDSIAFSMDVDNKVYPLLSSIFKQEIIDEIKQSSTYDLGKNLALAESKIIEQTKSLEKIDKAGISVQAVKVQIDNIELLKDELAVILAFNAEFNVEMKNAAMKKKSGTPNQP